MSFLEARLHPWSRGELWLMVPPSLVTFLVSVALTQDNAQVHWRGRREEGFRSVPSVLIG